MVRFDGKPELAEACLTDAYCECGYEEMGFVVVVGTQA